jgi:hypothetical protein
MKKIFLLTIISFTILPAAQFTFIDQQLTWTKGSNQQPTQLGPTGYNWITPHDYLHGDMYLRYEVISKPSDKTIAIQICAWQDSYQLENCANCFSYSGSKPAVYYFKPKSPADWWKKNGVSLDFTRKFQQVTVIHKDSNCGGQLMQTSMCGAACYPYSDIDQHVPITFKATAIFV